MLLQCCFALISSRISLQLVNFKNDFDSTVNEDKINTENNDQNAKMQEGITRQKAMETVET